MEEIQVTGSALHVIPVWLPLFEIVNSCTRKRPAQTLSTFHRLFATDSSVRGGDQAGSHQQRQHQAERFAGRAVDERPQVRGRVLQVPARGRFDDIEEGQLLCSQCHHEEDRVKINLVTSLDIPG